MGRDGSARRWSALLMAGAAVTWLACGDDVESGQGGSGGTATGTAAGVPTGTSAGTGTATGTATTPTACPLPPNLDYGDCEDVAAIGTDYCFIDELRCDGLTMVATWHDHDECGEPYLMTCDHACDESCSVLSLSGLAPPVPGSEVIRAMCDNAAGGAAGAGGAGGSGGAAGGGGGGGGG